MLSMEQGVDALDHFVAIEGLDEIVVRAKLQSGQAVLDVAAAGDEHDRDLRGALHRLESLADFPPAPLGHHHVEQDDVRQARLCDDQRFFPVARRQHLAIERTNVQGQQALNVFIIVSNQQDLPLRHRWAMILRESGHRCGCGVSRLRGLAVGLIGCKVAALLGCLVGHVSHSNPATLQRDTPRPRNRETAQPQCAKFPRRSSSGES